MNEAVDSEMQTMLERIEHYYGFIPKIYQELQRNPPVFKAFFYKSERLATDPALPALTKEFIAMSAAASLGSEYCLETHIQGAKRLGAQDDQIALAILIGASVAETTALSKSLRVWERSRV
ncbi:MAG: carboxymuconolactone decarboxylase family protein [Halobacteriota archaeon]